VHHHKMESEYTQPTIPESTALKSRGELQIARLLERNGIAYQYEYPLAVVDRGRVRLWYPDFRLPEYGLIIEYFGVNGDPGYDQRIRHKIETYRRAGIEGLFLRAIGPEESSDGSKRFSRQGCRDSKRPQAKHVSYRVLIRGIRRAEGPCCKTYVLYYISAVYAWRMFRIA